ncbi:MAG: asparagine synthase (glutamine-hydrolyzing), partial [Chitinivibrionales bacterium]|nr:asparagine synthase (glutamine-hydrolyzing) [Chitinivibrionales bacterium]
MCGIAGIAYHDRRPVSPELLRRMSQILAHRGPDDQGEFIAEGIGLSHRRLSIIDLKTGRQPLYNEDNSLVIIYNGEIYNYRELRRDLERFNHRFRTNSDTEVVLHAFEQWGPECLSTFNGMFGFAIYDIKRRELFLARDRLGIKPLYYHASAAMFVFASEIKALLPALGEVRENRSALYEFFTFQNILSSATFFSGVLKLPPGYWLHVKDGRSVLHQYWDIAIPADKKNDFGGAVQEYRQTLQASLSSHLIADVPVGAYLSSGMDSSSVAALAAQQTKGALHTFTGYFNDHDRY